MKPAEAIVKLKNMRAAYANAYAAANEKPSRNGTCDVVEDAAVAPEDRASPDESAPKPIASPDALGEGFAGSDVVAPLKIPRAMSTAASTSRTLAQSGLERFTGAGRSGWGVISFMHFRGKRPRRPDATSLLLAVTFGP
jgi:hypothetical protein